MLARIFPFLRWFRGYTWSRLRVDFLSGITVALVLVPQSMAYAQLAGLPAYYGLYAAFLPPLIASLFGSSHQLATGPVAVVSLMTAAALEPIATAGSASFIAYALLLALLVGIFQLSLGLFKLGLLVNFLSHPVVNGFTNAAALVIASSQLSKLFGVYVDKAEHHYETVLNVLKAAVDCTHWPTLGIAALAFVIMAGLRRLNPRIPNVLAAVIVTTILSYLIGFEKNRAVSLTRIESPPVRIAIQEFNGLLTRFDRLSEARVTMAESAGQKGRCKMCHHLKEAVQDPTGTLTAHHELNLLNLELRELKESIGETRTKLRAWRFHAVETKGGPAFYLADMVPEASPTDGRRWRLKVGNRRMDRDAITLAGGGAVVGVIPQGLPKPKMPKIDIGMMIRLLPMAAIISLLGFMEAISIAKAMAARSGQRLDTNQELIGQGLANIVGSVGQSYPVSGSFSRSAVNFQAGAVTGLSNVFSSVFVAITLLLFTPLLYHLPQAVLAAIIMMAVVGLINVTGLIHAWHAHKHDGIVTLVTFATTLAFAPHLDRGILIGVALSVCFYLYRTMKPNVSLLSKYTDASYRDSDRLQLAHCKHIAVIRCNSSLFFANTNYLEEEILEQIASMPQLRHVHIVGNAINEIDASGEQMLSTVIDRVREAGYGMSVSGVNDTVLDVMKRTGLYDKIGKDNLFPSVADTVKSLYEKTHVDTTENPCPLQSVVFKGRRQRSPAFTKERTVEGASE